MRLFTTAQKKQLFLIAKGKCNICGDDLAKNWNADHIIPYSEGGLTTIENGQALCESCNKFKSNKIPMNTNHSIPPLRKWQSEFYPLPFQRWKAPDKPNNFLLYAGVGAGKTRATVEAAKPFHDIGFQMVVISPKEDVKKKWATDFKLYAGIDIDYNYKFGSDWRRKENGSFDGISITYQILNERNAQILGMFVNDRTLFICDEIHHAAETKSWGDALLGSSLPFYLNLTGTPFREDNLKIPNVNYEPHIDGKMETLSVDFAYSYARSVYDKVCCPVEFIKKNQFTINGVFYQTLGKTDEDKTIYNRLIKIKQDRLTDAQIEIFAAANAKLDYVRKYIPNAGGLVICDTQEDADNLGKFLPDSVVVHSETTKAQNTINKFTNSNTRWLISVDMISEGTDIPRLRTLVYLSTDKTHLKFVQIMGRIIRCRNVDLEKKFASSNWNDIGYFFMFDFELLNERARQVEDELTHERFLIEEEHKRLEFEDRLPSNILPFEIDTANTAGTSYIVRGVEFNEDKNKEIERIGNITNTSIETLRQIISEIEKSEVLKAQQEAETLKQATEKQNVQLVPKTRSEEIGYMKSTIDKIVGKIAAYEIRKKHGQIADKKEWNTKMGFAKTMIHSEANRAAGFGNSSEDNKDLEKLTRKLVYLQKIQKRNNE